MAIRQLIAGFAILLAGWGYWEHTRQLWTPEDQAARLGGAFYALLLIASIALTTLKLMRKQSL
ncbi:MAG: hypothetical protein KIT45_09550 [Fimbriimonadia bacterium]|nr:hypothetical protein [Fimbriimonadia bacterium]